MLFYNGELFYFERKRAAIEKKNNQNTYIYTGRLSISAIYLFADSVNCTIQLD